MALSDRDLVQAIYAAFPANVAVPATVVNCQCDECAEIERDLRHRHWIDLDIPTLTEHYTALSLLTPEAFAHYVPAYMLAAISHRDVVFEEFVLMSLLPRAQRRDACDFTTEQCSVFRRFARWMVVRNPDWQDEAAEVERYWSRDAVT